MARPPTVDAHIDLPWVMTKVYKLKRDASSVADPAAWSRGGLDKPILALYLSDQVQDEVGPDVSWKWLQWQAVLASMQRVPLGIEGARLLPDNLDDLPKGVVYVTLTHNRDNAFAGSATDTSQKGLSFKGFQLVMDLWDRGIKIDISHASDQTVDDLLGYDDMPVIATHSGMRSLFDHPRNILPHHAALIVKRGGVVGIPAVKNFMGDTHPLDHIEEVMELTGTSEGVGIGSDLDGAVMVDGLPTAAQWWEFWGEGLAARGYSDEVVAKVVGGNWLRIFHAAA